ncbi:acyltransferase family protein [Noviherbaspirillum pedocola]|uniref:Acyltransferase n=1 Tax=Noviherbaspirillum pedocola TaxID=2801341 RepID=A0A934SX29_9BURK|nr:acyltransferase [Noviherbaspirillum pedocola]MBK4734294.1 acyltransferase [Noviherbaspirillum pedocola]
MLSDPASPIFAIVAIVVAFFYAALLARLFPAHIQAARISTLDGLRGFLVISVFLHHACIWFFYIKTSKWQLPPSYFYGNLGQISVSLFFMITAFLFFSKLLRATEEPIDWGRFYISRFMRLGPIYFLMLLTVCCIVMYKTDFLLHDAPANILRSLIKWIPFGILGLPDINGHRSTAIIVAHVIWSLPYELIFYAALPLIGFFVGTKRQVLPFLLSICACTFIVEQMHYPSLLQLSIFLGGIVAAYCARYSGLRAFCSGRFAGCVALLCLGLVFFMPPTDYGWKSVLLLSVVFIIIACGNSLFGVLLHRGIRLVGDMGYSVYLLHGIILFVTFDGYVRTGVSQAINGLMFWAVVCALIFPLITICYITFRFIELPAMGASLPLHARILRLLRRPASVAPATQG